MRQILFLFEYFNAVFSVKVNFKLKLFFFFSEFTVNKQKKCSQENVY